MEGVVWLEYGGQAMANEAAFFAIFITLISAYLVTAFVAGRKLTTAQLVLINIFFVFASTLNVFAQGTTLRNAFFAYERGVALTPDMDAVSPALLTATPIIVQVACAGIVIGCLKFMWDVRNPKD